MNAELAESGTAKRVLRLAYTNGSGKLAVIGDPVAHSLSPRIQNALLEHLGLDYIYLALKIPPSATREWVKAARLLDFAGFNATMPHKTALVPLMDTLSGDAARCRAVNTVVLRKGRLEGHNTDGEGFLRALGDAGVEVRGRNAVLLGAGGGARAVALKLAACGARRIAVCCRTPRQGELLRELDSRIEAHAWTPASLRENLRHCDVLINGTPLGMRGVGETFADLDFLDALPASSVVCDLIYSPLRTELLRAAAQRGHTAINGLGMLIHQAILALELFTATPIDAERAAPVAERALAGVLE